MPLQNFVDFLPPTVKAAWLNVVDALKFTVFEDATTKPTAVTALFNSTAAKTAGIAGLELQAQLVSQGVDSGAVNAAVVTLTGPVTAWTRTTGAKVSFTAVTPNTGATTLNVNGTGVASVLAQDGTPCTGGELSAPVTVEWTGAAWRIIAGGIPLFNRRTTAETTAGVIPVSYIYTPDPFIDPRRYHVAGTIGNPVDDLASINTAILVLKATGSATIFVPGNYSAAMTLPQMNLLANQAGCIIDQRYTNTGSFGAYVIYPEARDIGGGYASEVRIRGKQNPGLVLEPQSDGTAPGFSLPNNMTSIVGYTNSGDNNYQILSDPIARGYVGDFALIQFAQGAFTSFTALYAGVDANNKTRWDVNPALMLATVINIASVTNTTPVVINLASPHNINTTRSQVAIAGVTANINGSWIANITGPSQLTLINSVASGVFGAVGTATVFPNSMRASLNVPPVQGGTEAICSEGLIVSTVANGTAPISVTSQTPDVNLTACPKIVNINGVLQNNGTPGTGNTKEVIGNATIDGGGTVVITLTGDAVFVGANTYKCSYANLTGARAVQFTRTNGGSVTITGTPGDSIDFCLKGF